MTATPAPEGAESITEDELAGALARLGILISGNAYFPELARNIFGYVEHQRREPETDSALPVPDDTGRRLATALVSAREALEASSPERPGAAEALPVAADPARAAYEAEGAWLDEFSPGPASPPWDDLDPDHQDVYRRMAGAIGSAERARAERAEGKLAAILLAVRQSCACPSCQGFIAGAAGTGETQERSDEKGPTL